MRNQCPDTAVWLHRPWPEEMSSSNSAWEHPLCWVLCDSLPSGLERLFWPAVLSLDNMQAKACWYSGNTTTHLGAHLCTLFLGCALDPDHYCQIRSAWEGWNLWQMLPDATSMSPHMLLHRDFSNVLSSLMSGSRFNYQYGIFNGSHKYDFTAIKCCYWFL